MAYEYRKVPICMSACHFGVSYGYRKAPMCISVGHFWVADGYTKIQPTVVLPISKKEVLEYIREQALQTV